MTSGLATPDATRWSTVHLGSTDSLSQFLFSISSVFPRATQRELGPFSECHSLAPMHITAFQEQSCERAVAKKGPGDGRLGELVALLGELPKGFTVALAYPGGARTTAWPSAGTSKGWNTQAITLGLSFRRLVTRASESQGLVGRSVRAPVQMEKVITTWLLSHQLWL